MMHQAELTHVRKKAMPSLIIGLLLAIFIGPFLFAYTMYHRSDSIQIDTIHHGHLIAPPILADSLNLKFTSGASIEPKDVRGRWGYVYKIPSPCDDSCRDRLFTMRQLHKSLGKEMTRIQRVYLFTQQPDPMMSSFLKETYPDGLQLQIGENDYLKLENYQGSLGTLNQAEGAFFLIDPQGYFMMHYPDNVEPKSVIKDFKRLLKVSQVG